MAQVFTSSADIGGAIRSKANLSAAPFVSGYRQDSTSVNTGASGAWPLPQAGGFIPVQPLAPLTVTTSATQFASFTYIPTCTGALSSGPAPSLSGGGGNLYTTGFQVAPIVFDTQNNRIWIFNPVSSAWMATTTGAFTSTST